MEEDSPYRASKVLPTQPTDSTAGEVPASITRPIKHLWILLLVQTGIALVWGVIQIFSAPSVALIVAATFGTTAVVNAAFAYGVYKRVFWVAVVVACINVFSLLMELLSLGRGTGSAFTFFLAVAITYFGVRGAAAVREYRRFMADARLRPPGRKLSEDPAFAEKSEA
ncbi:hypothetical protein [Stenotrophomonas sp.]|uniref:hypothetical protein n=1 Tax=Stenotrophomonas sp. TaxID=69392 RepID=UPI00289DBA04|nr:hypothetical protein [Stenotrophomonas sp.]